MSLVMREGRSIFSDIIINDQILFDNWELEENNISNAFEINNNGINAISVANSTLVSTFASNVDISAGQYSIGGTPVLSATILGTAVVNSSLTSNTGNLTNTGTLNLTTGNDYNINSVSVLSATTLGSAVVNSSLTSNTGNLTNTGTFSNTESLNLTTGKDFTINSVSVLNATTLGTAVVNSSLTNVGTLTALTVNGDSLLGSSATSNEMFIGNIFSSFCGLLHNDKIATKTTSYALIQDTAGKTLLNSASGNPLVFSINNSEKMQVASSGNVGINDNSPSSQLVVDGDCIFGSSTTSNEMFIGQIFSDFCGLIHNDVIGSKTGSYALLQKNDGTTFINAANTKDLTFRINNTEKMRVDSNGNIGINDTNPSCKFVVAGDVNFSGEFDITFGDTFGTPFEIGNQTFTTPGNVITRWNSGIGSGRAHVLADGDFENINNSYSGISDIRKKEQIVDCKSQWDDIKAMRFVNYKLKDEVVRIGDENVNLQIGVLAQELLLTSPKLVRQNKEGFYSVKYSILYVKGMKALQESMIRIETLEAENISIKLKIDDEIVLREARDILIELSVEELETKLDDEVILRETLETKVEELEIKVDEEIVLREAQDIVITDILARLEVLETI